MATCKPTVEDLTTQLYQQQERSQLLSEQINKLEMEKASLQAQLTRSEIELRNLQSRVQAD